MNKKTTSRKAGLVAIFAGCGATFSSLSAKVDSETTSNLLFGLGILFICVATFMLIKLKLKGHKSQNT